jgi:hypothetical protein
MRRPRQTTSLYEGAAYRELFSSSQLNVALRCLLKDVGGGGIGAI